jgi:hypothetical protein
VCSDQNLHVEDPYDEPCIIASRAKGYGMFLAWGFLLKLISVEVESHGCFELHCSICIPSKVVRFHSKLTVHPKIC